MDSAGRDIQLHSTDSSWYFGSEVIRNESSLTNDGDERCLSFLVANLLNSDLYQFLALQPAAHTHSLTDLVGLSLPSDNTVYLI